MILARAPLTPWLVVAALAACTSSTSPPVDASTADTVEVSVDVVVTPDSSVDAPDSSVDDVVDASDDVAPAPGSFGQPCTVGRAGDCLEGLFCLQGPSGGRNGFCTRTCPRTSSARCADTPPGTAAYCLVTDVNAAGDKGCAFVCTLPGMTFTCPGTLRCVHVQDPPGSGQELCLP